METLISVVALVMDEGSITIPSETFRWAGAGVAGLLGSGGLVAWFKLRSDSRAGVASHELAEDQAISQNWQRIIEIQTEALIQPLQNRLQSIEAEFGQLKMELEASRRKYWSAISYIRQLLLWFNRHMADDLERTALPDPPKVLVEDL